MLQQVTASLCAGRLNLARRRRARVQILAQGIANLAHLAVN